MKFAPKNHRFWENVKVQNVCAMQELALMQSVANIVILLAQDLGHAKIIFASVQEQ
jgi:hypothetical protein